MLAHSRSNVKIQMPIISGYISAPKNCEIPRQSWLSWISLGGNIRWKAYEYGRFQPSGRPWLGDLLMIEEDPASIAPKRHATLEPFAIDHEFQGRSYAGRYELVCQRLLRERLYDAACFITSNAAEGARGKFTEPNPELGIRPFAISLSARARAFAELG